MVRIITPLMLISICESFLLDFAACGRLLQFSSSLTCLLKSERILLLEISLSRFYDLLTSTVVSSSPHRFSVGFKSGLRAGQ